MNSPTKTIALRPESSGLTGLFAAPHPSGNCGEEEKISTNSQSQQTPYQAQNEGPHIYVACLAAYNNGYLHEKWIDADQDAEAIQSDITAMLAASPIPHAEEWAIHDYEGFEGTVIEEYSSIKTVAKFAVFVTEHGELGGKLLANFNGNLEDAEAAFEDYAGEHKSLAEFAQELIEQTTEIPQNLANYIDYDAISRDMELNGDVFTIELGLESVHIFWSR